MTIVDARQNALQIKPQLHLAFTICQILIARPGQAVHVAMRFIGFGEQRMGIFQHVRKEQEVPLVGVPFAVAVACFHFGIGYDIGRLRIVTCRNAQQQRYQ